MKAGYVCLDVGGTEIKSAAVTPAGEVVEPVAYAPARASEAAQAVIAHLAGVAGGQSGLRQGYRLVEPLSSGKHVAPKGMLRFAGHQDVIHLVDIIHIQ